MKVFAAIAVPLVLALLLSAAPARAQNGSIQFVARATPSGGVDEPVRGFPFYLLRKSFEDINKEAEATFPKPNMDAFIDGLDCSPELKAWMKIDHWVRLSGDDFLHKLKPDDVMDVPEFFTAYVQRNSNDRTVIFPSPKYKPADKVKDPAKYEKLHAEYIETVHHYLIQNPKSTEGMDLELEDVNPVNKWDQIQTKGLVEFHREIMELAESKYLAGRTDTDLQGQGFLRNIPPGAYWLSTLGVSAMVGDARPMWDTPLTVRAGELTQIALSSNNSVMPAHTSP